MISPTNITNHNRSQSELEEFLLFCIMVAGKSAKQTAQKLNLFLHKRDSNESPLEYVDNLLHEGYLEQAMRNARLGQYGRLGNAFAGIVKFQGRLHEVSVEDLESINGIGPKTARFFLLHSRPDQRLAVLDTHLLAHMREDLGMDVPKSTPNKNKYKVLEEKLLKVIDESGKTFAEYDLDVWKSRSQK